MEQQSNIAGEHGLAALDLLHELGKIEDALKAGAGHDIIPGLINRCRTLGLDARGLAHETAANREPEEAAGTTPPDFEVALLIGLIEAIRRLLNVTLRTLGLQEIPPFFGPELEVEEYVTYPHETSDVLHCSDAAAAAQQKFIELFPDFLAPNIKSNEIESTTRALQSELASRIAMFREGLSSSETDAHTVSAKESSKPRM